MEASIPSSRGDVVVSEPQRVWPQGEVRHERDAVLKPPVMMSKAEQDLVKNMYSKEQQREWGYPEYPAEYDDPQWLRAQFELERNDPRENANFFLTPEHPEFYHNAARKPVNKAILKTEQHWNFRRDTWKNQRMNVDDLNRHREEVAELLEDCSMEVKRLVAPIMKYTAVQVELAHANKEAKANGLDFRQFIEMPDNKKKLMDIRVEIDTRGPKAAEEYMDIIGQHSLRVHETEQAKKLKERREQGKLEDPSLELLRKAMSAGARYKKDGVLEWEKGNYKDALESWRLANEQLQKYKAPASCVKENKDADELHIAVLKNLSQCAIKLENWNEALEAAEDALQIDHQDHKAWFRKACALEGLGRLGEIEECLQQIDDISVGRPDRDRIQKDTKSKREKIQAIKEKDEMSQKRILLNGVQKKLFSEDRQQNQMLQPKPTAPPLMAPPRFEFVEHEGYIPGGKTLYTEVMTIEEAKKKCESLTGCKGFMFKGAVREGRMKMSFKDKWETFGTGWTSFSCELVDPARVDEVRRKRITKDGAFDLLEALWEAYSDAGFQAQIRKLSHDMLSMGHGMEEFRRNLAIVALPVQKPVLQKWGFDCSQKGVLEMIRALTDHTRGSDSDPKLRERGEQVNRLLYGDMYDIARAHALGPQNRAAALPQTHKNRDGSDSDE